MVTKVSDSMRRVATTIAEIEGLTGITGGIAVLNAGGRSGTFAWDGSNLQSEVTADTEQGIYIAPSGEDGSNGAWVRQYKQLFAEFFGFSESNTGAQNKTAIEAAAATGEAVNIGDGEFKIADVNVENNYIFRGQGREKTAFVVDTNGAAAFLNDKSGDLSRLEISGMTIKAGSGVTGARAFNQTDKSIYTAYAEFKDLETWSNLEISFEGFFIFASWKESRDGFFGSPPGGQTHQFINSIPAAFGQSKQTNLNSLDRVYIFNADNADGAVDIAYGSSWRFSGCDFESLSCRAVRARGIFTLVFDQGTWFEGVAADECILAGQSPAPNPQGSRPVLVDGCWVNLASTTVQFANIGTSSDLAVTNSGFTNIPSGVVLANEPLHENYGNEAVSGAGTTGFFTGTQALRNNIEFDIAVINSPQTQNQNVLPIGPNGLGASNFTAVGYTGLTDVASAIGLAGNAIQVTVSAGGDALYYEIPAKLRTFLEGQTLTLVALGYGNGGTAVFGQLSFWEDVTPAFGNETAKSASANSINATTTDLQMAYVTAEIGTGLSNLYIGMQSGGVAGSPQINIETMALVLGEIKPNAMSVV